MSFPVVIQQSPFVDWPHREQTDYLHMMGISYM